MTSEILSNREIRRYADQMALPGVGEEGQEKIKKAKVVVVGTGGIGTTVMQHLVVSGIGSLGIIDNALVEESNIHRQTLYGTSDLGKQKAIIAKQRLSELNAQTELHIHNLCISYNNLDQVCKNYNYVVDATNSIESNKAVWQHCSENDKTLIYGHQSNYSCEIGIFTDPMQLKSLLKSYEFNKREENPGFLSALGGILGSLITIELIKCICGQKPLVQDNFIRFSLNDIFKK